MARGLPAIEGGSPVRTEYLPFARPAIGDDEIREVEATLRSGWLTVGPRTRKFERVVAEYLGVEQTAAVSSCTAALHLAMVCFGIGPGDEVVLPTLNFAAAPNMVIHLGAKPVFADVDPVTMNVTPSLLDVATTDHTKLYVPVHFGGRPCEIDEIVTLGRSRGVRVLGDAAHAIGADVAGRKIGTIADATAFSFYVTKGITTGEGGVVSSKDPAMIERARLLSLHGMSSDAWKRYSEHGPWFYEILDAGYKYNMNDVQAAMGLCQMEKVDAFREARQRVADFYTRALGDMEGITVPPPFDVGHHAWHLYPIRIDLDSITIDRDRFIQALLKEGIGVSVHFIPLHLHPFYRDRLGYGPGSFPAAEEYFRRAVSLPIYPSMTDEDVRDVVLAIAKLLDHYKR